MSGRGMRLGRVGVREREHGDGCVRPCQVRSRSELDRAEWVNLVTPGLPSSQLVEFPFTGHAVFGKSASAADMMRTFLDDPTQKVDDACAGTIELTFLTGDGPG